MYTYTCISNTYELTITHPLFTSVSSLQSRQKFPVCLLLKMNYFTGCDFVVHVNKGFYADALKKCVSFVLLSEENVCIQIVITGLT